MALVLFFVLLFCIGGIKAKESICRTYYRRQDVEKSRIALAKTKDGSLPLPGDEIFLRKDIEASVKQKFFDRRFECLEEIQGNLTEVFGTEWQQMFRGFPCYYGWYKFGKQQKAKEYDSFLTLPYFRNIWNIAYQIWLSKQGFIPYGKEQYSLYEENIGGFVAPENDSYTCDTIIQAAINETRKEEDRNRQLIIRACKVIERNMRQNHLGKVMCLANSSPGDTDITLRGVIMYSSKRGDTYTYPSLIWSHVYRKHHKIPLSFPW